MAMADACKKKPAPKEYSCEVVSASLVAQIYARDLNRKPCEEFSLGMSEWMDDADEASGKEGSIWMNDSKFHVSVTGFGLQGACYFCKSFFHIDPQGELRIY